MDSVERLIQRIQSASDRSTFVDSLKCTKDFIQASEEPGIHATIFNVVIAKLTPSLVPLLTKQEKRELIHDLFTVAAARSCPEQTLLSLYYSGLRSGELPAYNKQIVLNTVAIPLFTNVPLISRIMKLKLKDSDKLKWDERRELIQVLTSFPEIVSNLTSMSSNGSSKMLTIQRSSIFEDSLYLKTLSIAIRDSLTDAHSMLAAGEDGVVSLGFHAGLLARLHAAGYADTVLLDLLIPWLLKQANECSAGDGAVASTSSAHDQIWCRIAERLFTSTSDIPSRSMDAYLSLVIQRCGSGAELSVILRDSPAVNRQIRALITRKMWLNRSVDLTSSINQLGGKDKRRLRFLAPLLADYFLCSPGNRDREQLLADAFTNVMDVWADRSALAHSSVEQRRYLSGCVLAFGTRLKDAPEWLLNKVKDHGMRCLLIGVQNHLNSSQPCYPLHGILVGQTLSSILQSEGASKLSFDDVDMENGEIQLLMSCCGRLQSLRNEENLMDGDTSLGLLNLNSEEPIKELVIPSALDSDDDDDDDDLVAYHIPEKYLKKDGPVKELINELPNESPTGTGRDDRNEPPVFEAGFRGLERLLTDLKTVGVRDHCSEIVSRLLTLENRFGVEDFDDIVLSSLTWLCVRQPTQAPILLSNQFFDKQHCLRERHLILQALSDAAKQLSTTAASESKKPVANDKKQTGITNRERRRARKPPSSENDHQPEWQREIDERVRAKTRLITSGRSGSSQSSHKKIVANQFAAVAEHFFFPLITLYHSGTRSLLVLLWSLRFHPESLVRQGVLFSLNMLAMTLPRSVLTAQLSDSLDETVAWLKEVYERDPITTNRQMAGNCLLLLAKNIQTEEEAERTREILIRAPTATSNDFELKITGDNLKLK